MLKLGGFATNASVLSMKSLVSPSELRAEVHNLLSDRKTVGFVPTMGALHKGHLSLIREARKDNDIVVVSIFVNPTQFGPTEDFDAYPRDENRDKELLKAESVDICFLPEKDTIYPSKVPEIRMGIRSMADQLCGKYRPGHFEGVVEVVSRLFNIVRPDRAYFGMKDYQQLAIIRRLNLELHFGVQIVGCPIIREDDGLAMSSRNRYLDEKERKKALFLNQALKRASELAKEGMKSSELRLEIIEMAERFEGVDLEYFEIRSEKLEPVDDLLVSDNPVALIAAYVGKTRLIDNRFLF